jgi:5-methyltetrahydrofolate--homocysteine methyltransferase
MYLPLKGKETESKGTVRGDINILALSALLTTTMPQMKKVIEELKARDLRDRVKVMVGNAPVNDTFAEKIGADAYGKDAFEAVEMCRRFVGQT